LTVPATAGVQADSFFRFAPASASGADFSPVLDCSGGARLVGAFPPDWRVDYQQIDRISAFLNILL
jgi:hypothetical protein